MSALVEGLPLWLAQTNCWVVAPNGPGGECVLIDAPPEPARIVQYLQSQGLRLVALLSTHGHIDHIGGIGTVIRDASIAPQPPPVHIHAGDRHMLADPMGTSGMFAQYLGEELDLRPPETIYGLDDGEVITGAGMRFEALHTPGHTPGSTCFTLTLEGETPMLFSGDHLFAGSVGRTDGAGGSWEQMMASMAEKILPLPNEMVVLPGHGGSTSIGWERRTNPFLVELQWDLGIDPMG